MNSNLCNQYLIGVIRDFWTFSEISQKNGALNYVEFRACLALPNCLIVTEIIFNTSIILFTTRLSNLKAKVHPLPLFNS
jgi:hypothetical protein